MKACKLLPKKFPRNSGWPVALSNRSKEIALHPQVVRGLLGPICPPLMQVAFELTCAPVNLGLLGLGYFTYMHRDSPNFTEKNISYATVGLITWFSGQGYIVEKYPQDHLGKQDDYARMKGGVKGGAKRTGLKTVENEFGSLGGVRKSDAERVYIAVDQLQKKKGKAGVPCVRAWYEL